MLNATVFGLHAGVNDRDVYLHTLPMFHANGWGMPYVTTGLGAKHVVLRKVDGAEILRRIDEHGVTLMCAAPAVVSAALEAAATWDGEIPGRDRVRIIVAGAPPPTRTIERVMEEPRLAVQPDLRPHRDLPIVTVNRMRAEWDDLSVHEQAKRLGRAGAPALGVRVSIDPQGEVLTSSNHNLDGYWEQPEETARVQAATPSTPVTAATSTTRATWSSPTARRT